MENEKWTGHVERDGHFAAFYLTPPPAAVARFQTAQRTLSQPIKIARADYLDPIYDYKGFQSSPNPKVGCHSIMVTA